MGNPTQVGSIVDKVMGRAKPATAPPPPCIDPPCIGFRNEINLALDVILKAAREDRLKVLEILVQIQRDVQTLTRRVERLERRIGRAKKP